MDSSIEEREEIIGNYAFKGFAIDKAQPDPKSVEFWPAEERLALGLKFIGELADKENRADFGERNFDMLAVGSQQIDRVGVCQTCGIEITAQRLLVREDDNNLLVSRGWGSELQVLALSGAKKPNLRIG